MIKDATRISLEYNVSFKDTGGRIDRNYTGISCTITKGKEYSSFSFQGEDRAIQQCVISNETFDEIKNLLLGDEITIYKMQTDSSGKFQNQEFSSLVIVEAPGQGNTPVYISEATNMNKVVDKLKAIYESMRNQ